MCRVEERLRPNRDPSAVFVGFVDEPCFDHFFSIPVLEGFAKLGDGERLAVEHVQVRIVLEAHDALAEAEDVAIAFALADFAVDAHAGRVEAAGDHIVCRQVDVVIRREREDIESSQAPIAEWLVMPEAVREADDRIVESLAVDLREFDVGIFHESAAALDRLELSRIADKEYLPGFGEQLVANAGAHHGCFVDHDDVVAVEEFFGPVVPVAGAHLAAGRAQPRQDSVDRALLLGRELWQGHPQGEVYHTTCYRRGYGCVVPARWRSGLLGDDTGSAYFVPGRVVRPVVWSSLDRYRTYVRFMVAFRSSLFSINVMWRGLT